jgi:hypothetical protein
MRAELLDALASIDVVTPERYEDQATMFIAQEDGAKRR